MEILPLCLTWAECQNTPTLLRYTLRDPCLRTEFFTLNPDIYLETVPRPC